MTVSKIRLPDNTEHDIRAKYLIQSTSADATSAEFSARTVTEDAIANIQKIYGNIVKWNQLVQTNWFASTSSSDVTFTNNGDGSYTINGTASAAFRIYGYSSRVSWGDHKYYLSVSDTNIGFYYDGNPSNIGVTTESKQVVTAVSSATYRPTLYIASGKSFSNKKIYIIIVDLTAIYGSGNEPSASEFEAQYPASYYPYDPGSLVSNSATAILSRGFNQWDEEWEAGGIDTTTGQDYSANNIIRAKNYTPVTGGQSYYIYMGSARISQAISMRYYDANKNFLGTTDKNGNSNGANLVRVMPDNCTYIRFVTSPYYGSSTTYLRDICINISDQAKNGTYEPYNGHQIDLNIPTLTGKLNGTGSSVVIFPNGMQLNGTTRDEITATSAIKRIADDNSVLSTPQTYILDNALQLQYPVVAGGTEMVLPTTGTAPMKMDVIYGNAADAAATMSQNFISVDSMKEFLEALGTQMGGTWSMGYENGKHTFTFTSN